MQNVLGIRYLVLPQQVDSLAEEVEPCLEEAIEARGWTVEGPEESPLAFVVSFSNREIPSDVRDLLNKMIGAMKLSPEQVLLFGLSCDELGEQDLLLLKEEFRERALQYVVAFGAEVTALLVSQRLAFETLVGKWQSDEDLAIMPTLDVNELGEDKEKKRVVWRDLQSVMKALG
jgi:hypothetical protein